METKIVTATATEAIDTVERIATETGTAMEIESVTATGTGTATVAAATPIVVTEMEARGTERIGEVRGTEEMIALLSLNHRNVERAGGTTKGGEKKHIIRIICATNCSMMSLSPVLADSISEADTGTVL